MAELIPIEYRLRSLQRHCVRRWIFTGVAMALVAASALAYVGMWKHERQADRDALRQEFQEKSTLIARSQDLRARRLELAGRMEKIERLMDDKVLLSLLRNVSKGFSGKDCLEFISIDARAQTSGKKAPANAAPRYVVHITGITESSTTLAELMTRLGRKTYPPVNVVLEASRREKLLDGQVMRFQIVCEKADTQGT